MWDKYGRYVKIEEAKERRVYRVSGESVVFIAHEDVPAYQMIESIEKTYGPPADKG